MSHLVQIKTEVRDPVAVQAACMRCQLPAATYETVKLFASSATGMAVKLPGWRYPVVFDIHQAQVCFDNYAGRWGEQRELDHFLQAYAIEKTRLEARKRGYSIQEQPLVDGSVKLVLQGSEA